MVSKASLQETIDNKYVGYIKKWMIYAKDIGNIEIHHVLDYLRDMFDKLVACSTINSVKCVVATIFRIRTNPSQNNYLLVVGLFNLRLLQPKQSRTATRIFYLDALKS